MSIVPVPLRKPMSARDPHEHGRVATSLELLFDLIFVVAIASNAAQLHHGLSEGHFVTVLGYTMSWFAIWWAWVNYSWFASAYDNDDVIFRLLTFVIMSGALTLAAGIPDLFADGQSLPAVIGYAVMRIGMVGLWLRAASGHPERRATALTYAGGILLAQLWWIGRLWVPSSWYVVTFFIGVALELSVPVVAERRHGITPYHPHHIAERYGLLAIIVLGEVILSSVQAIQGVMAAAGQTGGDHGTDAAHSGLSGDLFLLIAGGLLLVFSLWWLYFKREHVDLVEQNPWVFGYGHLLIFASIAAVGASLAAAVDVVEGSAHVGSRPVGLAMAAALALTALSLAGIHAVCGAEHPVQTMTPAVAVAVGVVIAALVAPTMGWSVLLMGVIYAFAVAQHVVRGARALSQGRLSPV